MNTELLKKTIQKNAEATVEEFQKRDDIICRFDKPLIAYVNAEDVRFDMFFTRGLSDHPKNIYRPGRTIVLHYTPLSEDIVRANEAAAEPTEEWIAAGKESLWLAMELNKMIRKALGGQGRLTSCLNTMMEWNEETCREPWSHKLAAVAGGIGEIGPAGCLYVNGRYGGRVGGIITDGIYTKKEEALTDAELRAEYDRIVKASVFEGPCSREMIEVCPGGAISADGIDRFKCQEYCRRFNERVPAPEMCGKCFRFKD